MRSPATAANDQAVTGFERAPIKTPTIGARIAQLQAEIVVLQQEQRAALVAAIRFTIGPGVVFGARELFQHRVVSADLATAFADAGIQNARVLEKRLRQSCGHGLDRVSTDHNGALWTCP